MKEFEMITQVTDMELTLTAERDELKRECQAWATTVENLEKELEKQRRTHCACVFEGDAYVEQCKLHAAWNDTLHEQAEYHRECDGLKEDLAESRLVVEQRNAMISRGIDDFVQTLTDPENQPSQWGTVTLAMYRAVEAERDALKAANNDLQGWYDTAISDAKRYQWITKQITSDTFDNLEKAFGVFGDAESCTQAEFDACIDAAMQEANHG